MKAFRFICAALIFAIAAYSTYKTVGNLSASPYCFIGLMLICFYLVITDGLKERKHG
jgi:hypothetical protein